MWSIPGPNLLLISHILILSCYSGYLGNAEINELISRSGAEQTFHDGASNSDILLYQGDYVSYMTPTTKETRRADVRTNPRFTQLQSSRFSKITYVPL